MDHIPLPRSASPSSFKFPFLANRNEKLQYDGLGFLDFPERHDWTLEAPATPSGQTYLDFLSLLQSWCYFGLVIEFFCAFRIHVELEDFLRTEDDSAGGKLGIVSTRELPSLLLLVEEKTRDDDDEDDIAESFETVTEYLDTIRDYTTALDIKRLQQDELSCLKRATGPLLIDSIHLSIIILGSYLDQGAFFVNTYGGNWGTSPLLRERLLAAGWCRSETYSLIDQLSNSPESLYYLSCLTRYSLGRQHEHASCTESFRCAAENLDHGLYATKHTDANCQCEDVILDHTTRPEMTELVLQEKIPVVTVSSNQMQLKPHVQEAVKDVNWLTDLVGLAV